MLGLFAIGASFILLMLVPKLRALIQEKKNEASQTESTIVVANRVALCE